MPPIYNYRCNYCSREWEEVLEEKVSKTYTATVQEDAEGNAFIELPPELLSQLDWIEGDELVWDEMEVDDDGKFKRAVLYKNKDKKSKNAI